MADSQFVKELRRIERDAVRITAGSAKSAYHGVKWVVYDGAPVGKLTAEVGVVVIAGSLATENWLGVAEGYGVFVLGVWEALKHGRQLMQHRL